MLKFLACIFLSTLFCIAISCGKGGNSGSNTSDSLDFKKLTEYVEGEGYCVEKYDKKGCNTCFLEYGDNVWTWSCESRYCEETDEENKNKCTKYLSQEDILKKKDSSS